MPRPPLASLPSVCSHTLANCPRFATLFDALSFQQLPIVKFCKPFVLITIQNAGVYPEVVCGVRRLDAAFTPSAGPLRSFENAGEQKKCRTSEIPAGSLPAAGGPESRALQMQKRRRAIHCCDLGCAAGACTCGGRGRLAGGMMPFMRRYSTIWP